MACRSHASAPSVSGMEFRQLGASGLRVSALALGTNTFGGRGKFSVLGATGDAGARRLLDIATEAGVNLVDTADEYSDGDAERILGAALKGRRDRVLISTKLGTATEAGPNGAGSTRHHLTRALEASLRRLGTDYVDLLSLHCWDGHTPLDETLSALDSFIRAGKVRYIGASNFSAWHLGAALALADRRGYARLVSHQIHYSLLVRDAEHELLPAGVHHGVGALVWSPLAGGWLTGKYRRGADPPTPSRHAMGWNEPPVMDQDRLFAIVDALARIAQPRGASPALIALAWLSARPGVTSLIIGARTDAQLSANLKAAAVRLSDAERATLDALSLQPAPYPLWHQATLAADRLSPADEIALRPYLPASSEVSQCSISTTSPSPFPT